MFLTKLINVIKIFINLKMIFINCKIYFSNFTLLCEDLINSQIEFLQNWNYIFILEYNYRIM